MDIFALSDKGRVRFENEDSFEVGALEDGSVWAVVCDGMGGASGGAVASKMCTKTVSDHIKKGYREKISSSSLKNLLCSAVIFSNAEVFDASQLREELYGMGTTVVAAVITREIAVIAHAGDSRAYLLRDGTLTQLTKDHSMVRYLVDIGQISEDEAQKHPDKNIITRAVGAEKNINVDIDMVDLLEGDIIVICTDGLTNFVSDSKITETADSCESLSELVGKLIDAANSGGGRDNITVAVAEC